MMKLLPDEEVSSLALGFYLSHKSVVEEMAGTSDLVLAPKYVADVIRQIYGRSFKIAPKDRWEEFRWFSQAVEELVKTTDDYELEMFTRELHDYIADVKYRLL